jgi:hypothetical protein
MTIETRCVRCGVAYVVSPQSLRAGGPWWLCGRCRADRAVEEAVAAEVLALAAERSAGSEAIAGEPGDRRRRTP